FIWSDKKSPVKEDMLLAPKDIGGRGLLDIQARNEAIQLMWLESYLNLDSSHTPWAEYADAIMMMNIPKTEKNIKPEMRTNILLQTWKTYTGSHPNNKNPTEIKNMMDSAKKYGLQMEAHTNTKDTTRQLPIWYHAQADRRIRRLATHQSSKCLLRKHKILTVGD
ncbi:hypothetical protein L208DRAFT_1159287, partial [Tricholoma matsutake]